MSRLEQQLGRARADEAGGAGQEIASPLLALEARLALLDEGGEALVAVLAREQRREGLLLERVRDARRRRPGPRAARASRAPRRAAPSSRACARPRAPPSSSSVSSSNTRFTRPMRSATSAPIASPLITSSRAQPGPTRRSSRLVPPKPGISARFTSGWPSCASPRRVDPVAGERELEPAAEREAVHRRDHRHRQRLERAEGLVAEPAEGLGLERRHALHLGDVGARREGAARARHHHGAHRGVRRELGDARARAPRACGSTSAFSCSGRFKVSSATASRRSEQHELGQASPPRNARHVLACGPSGGQEPT